jgi:hypothetical protein
MPDKPTWIGRLDEIAEKLRALPDPSIDRACVEDVLGVGRRRAQQLLAPCVSRQVGSNGLADREALIAHLARLASGDSIYYEKQRRDRFARRLDELNRERRQAVMVAAPAATVNQELERLPKGVSVEAGVITIRFGGVTDALEKLLALAMAIRNDELLFERLATGAR